MEYTITNLANQLNDNIQMDHLKLKISYLKKVSKKVKVEIFRSKFISFFTKTHKKAVICYCMFCHEIIRLNRIRSYSSLLDKTCCRKGVKYGLT